MLPTVLITFREVIEASLIVATILGILVKIGQRNSIKTVWIATATAAFVCIGLLVIGSIVGLKIQELYTGTIEQITEGVLMVTSAVFITWAVFFLHSYFARYKTHLLQKIKATVEKEEQKGLFILVFTAVFREGFEIVLFLSTVFLSSDPQTIFSGFLLGAIAALIVAFGLFSATIKLPVFQTFRITSILLITFAGGLLARGVHEFAEAGLLPEIGSISLTFLPHNETLVGGLLKAIFGITQHMDYLQLTLYVAYLSFMSWRIFLRKSLPTPHQLHQDNKNEDE